jgi:hypothetical protein
MVPGTSICIIEYKLVTVYPPPVESDTKSRSPAPRSPIVYIASTGSIVITQILLGNPHNLFVFDFGRAGTGSAPFNGDETNIEDTWELVQRNAFISGSKGALYRPPEGRREVTVVTRG